jgi:hypothetical protein
VCSSDLGTLFHFLQAFWFRLVVDVRLAELLRDDARDKAGMKVDAA